MRGEDLIRIEHKLDALLWYMRKLTGEMPVPLSPPIPGLDGRTNNTCPITDTVVRLQIDPKSGDVVRRDGLSSGVFAPGTVSMIAEARPAHFALRRTDED